MHTDHLGSTNLVTNSAGSLVETTSYGPWGEVLVGGTTSKFLYTGQESDSETGLHYYNARYYNSEIRRFTQPDDIIQNIYEPQYLNRYSYVRNNPLKYTDPTGHVSILDYNKMLSNPTAQNYNNVMSQFAAVQGNTAVKGFSNSKPTANAASDPTLNTGARGYFPEMDKSEVRDVARPFYNHMIGNALKSIQNPNSTMVEKGWASIEIVGLVPVFGGVKLLKTSKVVDEVIDTSKIFNANQAALVELAKEAKRIGISEDNARTLVEWAQEVKLPSHGIMTHPGREFGQFPHINIGPIKHIFIN